MRQLITLTLGLMAVFVSIFLLMKLTGLLTLDDIKYGLNLAAEANPVAVAFTIILLLTCDLFIAVPTLSVCILAGYFLGFFWGGLTASIGMLSTGTLGYWLCYWYGPGLLQKIFKDEKKCHEMQQFFNQRGKKIILISRAMPMLPEISACLAGSNRLPFLEFLFLFSIATFPYGFIAAFAGSHSSIENPLPALLASILVPLTLWACWFLLIKTAFCKTTT